MLGPKNYNTLLVVMIILILSSAIQSLWAVPVFARRYKISCTTCHDPFPRLKPYGDEFAGDGFIMKEEERSRDYVSAGDDLLWLNKEFPLAVKLDAYSVFSDATDIDKDLQMPWGVKLLSGGTVYKDIGYYFYIYFSERGEVAGVEDAYLHFNDIFKSNLDIMAGQFQTSDPLMKRELRLPFEDYHIYKKKIGYTHCNLAYDRGIMVVYGLPQTGTDIIGMLVNGNGIPEAGDDHIFDRDKYKNGGLRINQSIGENLSVGGFFYSGKEKGSSPDTNYTTSNELIYLGPDLTCTIDRFSFTGQYLLRRDTNPLFTSNPGDETITSGIVAELLFAPQYDRSRFYGTLLYNMIDSDLSGHDYQTVSLSGTYLLSRNLRLMAEYIRDLNDNNNQFIMGVVSAF